MYLDHLGLEEHLQVLWRNVGHRVDLRLEVLEGLFGAVLELEVVLACLEDELNHSFKYYSNVIIPQEKIIEEMKKNKGWKNIREIG